MRTTSIKRAAAALCAAVITLSGRPAGAVLADPSGAVPIISSYDFNGNMGDSVSHYDGVKDAGDAYVADDRRAGSQALHVTKGGGTSLGGAAAALQNEAVGDSFTITSWMKFTENTFAILQKGDSQWIGQWWGTFGTNIPKLNWNLTDGGWTDGYLSSLLPMNEWVHWAFTFEKGVGMKFYLNGALYGTYAVGPGVALVGNANPFGFANFDGLIDSWRMYPVVLTPEQVILDMNDALETVGGGASALPAPIADYAFNGSMTDSVNSYGGHLGAADSYVEGRAAGTQALQVSSGDTDFSSVGGSAASLINALGAEFSVSSWMKITSPVGTSSTLFQKGGYNLVLHNNGSKDIQLNWQFSGGAWFNPNGLASVGPSYYDGNTWVHWTIVYKQGAGFQFYFNGQLKKDLNTGNSTWAFSLPLMNNNNAFDFRNLTAVVDTFRVYDVALTAEQVALDMAKEKTAGGSETAGTPGHNMPSIAKAASPTSSDRTVPMIARYEFDGDMIDSINGGGYNGTISASDAFVDSFTLNGGNRGKALDAGNGGDTVVGGAGAALTNAVGDQYTITAWIARKTANSDGSDLLFSKRGPGNTWDPEPFSMFMYPTVNKMNIATPGGWPENLWVGDNALNNTDWVHIAFSFSKSQGMDVYKNGDLMAHWGPEVFGGGVLNSANGIYLSKFHGLMDSLHIYAAKLSAKEVAWDRDGTIKTKTAVQSDLTDASAPPEPVAHAVPAITPAAPPTSSDRVVPMIARYDFEDNMTDSVNGYGGSLSASDRYVDSVSVNGQSHGKALWVGNGGYTTVGGASAALINAVSDQYTITAWVARDRGNVQEAFFSKRNNTGDPEPFRLTVFSGGDSKAELRLTDGTWPDNRVGNFQFNNTDWAHIAVTYQANVGYDLYKNGVKVGSLDAAWAHAGVQNNSNPVYLSSFKGLVDSVHIYPVKLTDAEVQWDRDGTINTRQATVDDIDQNKVVPPPAPITHNVPAITPAAPPTASDRAVPMIAKYEFDGNMTDSINGGGYNGAISASDSYVDSFTLNGVGRGKALDAGNGGDTIVGGANAALTNALGDKYTITAWVARNKADSNGSDTLFSKRWPGNNWDPEPFSMVLYATVNKMNIATPGGWPPDLWVGDNMLNNTDWAHIAVSFSKSEGMDVYKNGGLMAHWGPETFGGGVSNNANAIYLSQFHGLTDSLHIYAAKLSAAEVAWDRDGTIKTKTAVASDLTDSGVIQPPTPVPHAEPAFAITAPPADAPAVPIVADYEFEDNMLDTSGHAYDGTIGPYDLYADAFAYGGHDSRALWVTNADPKQLSTLGGSTAIQLNQLSDQYTVTAWIARDTTNTNCFLFAKRTADQSWMPSEPFLLRTWSGGDSQLNIMKGGWLTPNVGIIGLNTTAWTHYALTYRANQGLYIYINGAEKYHLGADVIDQGVVNNSNPIILSDFKGLIDSMRVYAVALTPEQVGWEMSGTLGTRPADAGDINKDPLPSPPVPPAAPPANPGGVWPGVPVNTAPEPIIASFNFDNNIQDQVSGLDNGKKSPAHSYSQGYFGQGLLMDGKPNVDMTILPTSDMLRRICGDFTVSMWIYPDKLSSDQMLLSKRWENNWQSTPLQLYLFNNGSVRYNGYYGTWYEVTTAAGAVSARKWTHIAVSFNNGEKARWYVNGVEVMSQDVPFDLAPNENEFSLLNFKGTLDELKFYSAVLTGDEVKLDMDGRLATRPAVWDDIPPVRKYVDAKLVRVDMPIGKTDMNNSHLRYYNQAERNLSGPNAVDWPEMTITIPDAEGVPATQPLFRNGSAEIFQIMMEMGDKRYDYFQLPTDSAIEPGNHWMRGISWLWGQCYIYSTDNSARSWMTDYELWTFPVIIKGAGKVTDVTLKYDGKAIYNKTGLSYDSLTLLLPASAKNKSYSISVNGGAEQSFEAGWKPIEGGNPVNERTDINLVTDTGFTVQNLKNPEKFSNQAEWDADKAALSIGGPARPAAPVKAALPSEHLGLDVPRSGVTTYAAALAAGMDGGFYIDNSPNAVRTSAYSNIGTPATYARHISDLGIDLVYEQSKSGDGGQTFAGTVMDSLARALGEKNIKIGVVPDAEFGRPFLQHPNLSLFSYSLPEYHAPLYRETALTAQRLLGYGNMAGVNVGADNSAYEAYWSWAPVIPNRPFGEALSNLYNSDRPEMLISPTLRGTWYGPMDYETYAGSVADFVNYLTGFNDVFRQFGYFNNAVSSVDPSLTLISGSYGSSPGVGSSGGWAWGTIPVREMYENVSVMQAYDWNELNSSKPLHNVSLIDRMRSYYPNKAAWSILDDYLLHFEKMQREAEWAMALTRGLNGIGTNTVPNDVGDYAAPDKIAALKNVTDWAHRYGGTFAMTEPDASVGVMFVFEQALLKPVLHGVNGPFDQLYNASHEGKTNEAMVMLQAAGWPAKIITPEELRRGLPDGMKAILLVGLGGTDGSWHWYDGIEDELKAFADNGGIFVADDMSIVPAGVTAVKPGISMASYIGQSDKDETGTLINRNAANIEAFCGAMSAAGAEAPLAVTGQKDAWAVPSRAGNTEYLTVVNEKHDNNANEVTGRTVGLTWNAAKVSGKTVYDVRTGQRLETLPATADLTAHGFQYFALTQAEVTAPAVTVRPSGEKEGFYEAYARIENGGKVLTGIPLEITVTGNGNSATVYSATGTDTLLPLAESDAAGIYTVTVKELLSGLTGSAEQTIGGAAATQTAANVLRESDIAKFAGRQQPLTIALTNGQYADSGYQALAAELKAYYEAKGRSVTIGKAEPFTDALGVVTGIGLYSTPSYYPRWSTAGTDLILIGTDKTNALILDEARGLLLPDTSGGWAISYVNSAFAGEYDTLNILADSLADAATAATYITGGTAQITPAPPADLRVTAFDTGSIALAWNVSDGAGSYLLQYQEQGAEEWTEAGLSGTAYTLAGLAPDTCYNMRVRAVGAFGASSFGGVIAQKTAKAAKIDEYGADLASLAVAGYAIEPVFAPDVPAYTLTVPASVESVTITAAAAQAGAVIEGAGPAAIAAGISVITVKVTAAGGSPVKNYTVTVTRTAPVFAVTVKSMAAKIGKPLQVPFTYDGPGEIMFKSSNAAVCSVNNSGVLMPLKAGIAVITVSAPGFQDYVFAVTVTA